MPLGWQSLAAWSFCGILVTLFGRKLAFMVMLLVVKSRFFVGSKVSNFFFFLQDGKVYKISEINDKIGKTSNKKWDM